MEKTPENPLNIFSRAIGAMTAWAVRDRDPEHKPNFDWNFFNLDNLAACFNGVDQKNFLTDAPLESFLAELDPVDFALHRWIPEGVRVTLCAFPCDPNGLTLPPQYLNDSSNDIHPYFQLFFSKPGENSGLAIGFGQVKSAPYLQVIPEEIRLQCSFVVEYRAGEERQEGETDYQYFSRQMRTRYARLQELIKGRL